MIDQILEKLKNENLLCHINRGYEDGEDHGFILDYNKETVCIKKYDRDGFYDGIKIFWKSDIEELKYGGNDLESRFKFIKNRGFNLDAVEIDISGFEKFLESASRMFGYVSVNNDEEHNCYIGPILGHDDRYIHMVNYGNPGKMDKNHVLIAKSEVHSLDVDGVYERNLISLQHN